MRRMLLPVALVAVGVGCGRPPTPAASTAADPTPLVAAATGVRPSDPAADELQKFQGVWEVTGTDRGRPPEDWERQERKEVLEVRGRLAAISRDGGSRPAYFVLAVDPAASPKAIDLTESDEKGDTSPQQRRFTTATRVVKRDPSSAPPDDRPEPRRVLKGIYTLDGDRLKIATPVDGDARPTGFTARAPDPGGQVTRSGDPPAPPRPQGVMVISFRRLPAAPAGKP